MSSVSQEHDSEIDLRLVLALLAGGKWLILGCVAVSFCIAYIYQEVTRPVYLAEALIQVEKKQSSLPGISDIGNIFSGQSNGVTEIEVMKSGFVLGEAVEKEFLQISIKPRYVPVIGEFLAWRHSEKKPDILAPPYFGLTQYNSGGEYIAISGLHVADKLVNKPLLLKNIDGERFELSLGQASVKLVGQVGSVAKSDDGAAVILVSQLRANPGAEFFVSVKRKVDAINRLKGSLKIVEQGKNTGVIALSLEGTDRDKIRSVLDRIAEVYQRQNVQRLSEEAERSIEFLNVQIPDIRAKLEAAEELLNSYRAKSATLDMELETRATLNQIVSIESQLNALEIKESELSGRYTKDHPLYVALLDKRTLLEDERSRTSKVIENLPAKQQELLRLARDVQVTSAVYVQLLNKVEELKVARAGTVGNVRILENAYVKNSPIKPNKAIVKFFGIFFGFCIGIGIVVLRYVLRSGLEDPSEIQDKLNLPNYGVVPLSKSQLDTECLDRNHTNINVLAYLNDADLALEALRGTRTSLHFAMLEAKNNIVMLTGPSPDIGKSFIATNLAALIGASGQSVLLVDADLRRGHIHKSLGVSREPGLSEILSKDAVLAETLHKGIMQNVDFLCTGALPPNPSELFMTSTFTSFLDEVSKRYDIVLLDTPPVLAVTDACYIGKLAGTTMLVARHKKNSFAEVLQTKSVLDQLGVIVKGYIYNFMEYNNSGYSYYKNRYYTYKYDSAADDDK